MIQEEAIEQLQKLTLDWQDNGLDTKLNQTDITAIGVIVSELDKSNNKIEQYKKQVDTLRKLCRERIESCNAAIGNPDNTIISKTQLLLNEITANKRFLQILIDGSDE